jgi:hypothetical protein
MVGYGLVSSGLGWGQEEGCCEHGNESSDSIQFLEFLY